MMAKGLVSRLMTPLEEFPILEGFGWMDLRPTCLNVDDFLVSTYYEARKDLLPSDFLAHVERFIAKAWIGMVSEE